MLNIGTHQSFAKGYEAAGLDALGIGANTFQVFSRNPRGARARAFDWEDLKKLEVLLERNCFAPILIHAPYTLNACSPSQHLRQLALQMIEEDLERLEHLPGAYYVFHPGSHLGQGALAASTMIAHMLNHALRPGQKTTVLLETMSGKGTEVGGSFEELRWILDKVNLPGHVGVCFDACHLHDAGYDIVNHLDNVLEKFDHIIGLERLKAFHINDSRNPRGSRKDRHALLDTGHIGLPAIASILRHPALRRLPFILETPTDLAGHAAEIAQLRRLAGG